MSEQGTTGWSPALTCMPPHLPPLTPLCGVGCRCLCVCACVRSYVQGLHPERRYVIAVRANNVLGAGPFSDPSDQVWTKGRPSLAPTPPKPIRCHVNTLDVVWDPAGVEVGVPFCLLWSRGRWCPLGTLVPPPAAGWEVLSCTDPSAATMDAA